MKYGWKLKPGCFLKYKEGRRDFIPVTRNKNLFKSFIATAKGLGAKQNGCPPQNSGKHPCQAYDITQPTCPIYWAHIKDCLFNGLLLFC